MVSKWENPAVDSKNRGMNFIPIEYDFHPNEFHTYGMNLARNGFTFFLVSMDTKKKVKPLRAKFIP